MAKPSLLIAHPMPGFYRRRLAKNAPWVGVKFWYRPTLVEDEVAPDDWRGGRLADDEIACTVNGVERSPLAQWLWCAANPIPEAEYRFLIADRAHARDWRPNDPEAMPEVPVDLATARPVF